MIETLQKNPKLLVLAIIVAICTVISSVPGSIDFLSEASQKVARGISGIVTMVSAMLGFKVNPLTETKEKKE